MVSKGAKGNEQDSTPSNVVNDDVEMDLTDNQTKTNDSLDIISKGAKGNEQDSTHSNVVNDDVVNHCAKNQTSSMQTKPRNENRFQNCNSQGYAKSGKKTELNHYYANKNIPRPNKNEPRNKFFPKSYQPNQNWEKFNYDRCDGSFYDRRDGSINDRRDGSINDRRDGSFNYRRDGRYNDRRDGSFNDRHDGSFNDRHDRSYDRSYAKHDRLDPSLAKYQPSDRNFDNESIHSISSFEKHKKGIAKKKLLTLLQLKRMIKQMSI